MSETQVTTEAQFEDSDDLDAFEAGFFGRKPAVEEKPSATTEDVEQDTQEQGAEDTTTQTDEEDEAELKQEATPRKKTVQDRIDEVVRQREEIRREAAAEAAKLRQEIEELRKTIQKPEAPVASDQEPQHDTLDKDGNPVYALGEFDPQYIRDLTRYTLNQERVKVQTEQAEAQRVAAVQQEQQTLQSSWNSKITQAAQQYPDLTEKGQALLANFNNLDQNYAAYLSTLLMQMDKGPEVLYYLSNNPQEAIQIVNSGAQKATLALGRIETRFLQDKQDTPKPRISRAPPPPPSRAQARGTNGAFIAVPPDTDDLDAFEVEFFKRRK